MNDALLLLLAYQTSLIQALRWANDEQRACLRASMDLTAGWRREAEQWHALAALTQIVVVDEIGDVFDDDAPAVQRSTRH